MYKPNFTIYDVAKAAKVSVATVSRVLNAPEKVSPDTRAVVQSVINQMGFVPKADARARAMKRNNQVGIISPHLTRHSLYQRLRGATEGLRKFHYEMVMYLVENESNLIDYLDFLSLNPFFDGLIIFSLPIPEEQTRLLIDAQLKLVLVDFQSPSFSSVFSDDYSGGRLAANYLYSRGHRQFGFIGDSDLQEYGVQRAAMRMRGYKEELDRLKIPLINKNILRVSEDLDATSDLIKGYLKRGDHPTAIFAANDLQGFAIMRAARELGIRIPDDIGILGFGNLDLADYVGLTTIDQHLEESGRTAVELLISRISDASRPVRHIQLPLNIVERETV
jgi:DNA-binding LacI/PurR family transcriptional regulator